MAAVPSSIKAPREPQVNLVPPEVAGRKARNRRVGVIGLTLVLFLMGAIAAGVWAQGVESNAKDKLAAAKADGEELTAKIAKYEYVVQAQTAFESATDASIIAGASEIQWATMTRDIQKRLPMTVNITSITWNPTTLGSSGDADTSPFAVPDVGSIDIVAQTDTWQTAVDLAPALSTVPGLTRPNVLSIVPVDQNGRIVYSVVVNARLTYLALSGHFQPWWNAMRDQNQVLEGLAKVSDDDKDYLLILRLSADFGDTDAKQLAAELQGDVDAIPQWIDQVATLAHLVDRDRIAIDHAATDIYDGVDANEDLAAAQESQNQHIAQLNALTLPLKQFIEASNALYAAQSDVYMAGAKVSAAQLERDAAKRALSEGEDYADERVADAEWALSRAERERDAADARFAEAVSDLSAKRDAAAAAVEAAAAVAPVVVSSAPESTDGDAGGTASDPLPSASPSPEVTP